MAHRVPFVVAELGADVEPFMLHLHAALAERTIALAQTRSGATRPPLIWNNLHPVISSLLAYNIRANVEIDGYLVNSLLRDF